MTSADEGKSNSLTTIYVEKIVQESLPLLKRFSVKAGNRTATRGNSADNIYLT